MWCGTYAGAPVHFQKKCGHWLRACGRGVLLHVQTCDPSLPRRCSRCPASEQGLLVPGFGWPCLLIGVVISPRSGRFMGGGVRILYNQLGPTDGGVPFGCGVTGLR